jgi:hypothetical protein
MCLVNSVFTASELKGLTKKKQNALQKYGVHLVDSSPAIRNIIKKDPKVRSKLKVLLRPRLKRLKSK